MIMRMMATVKKKKFAVAFTKFSLKTRQVGTFVSLVWNTTNKKKNHGTALFHLSYIYFIYFRLCYVYIDNYG